MGDKLVPKNNERAPLLFVKNILSIFMNLSGATIWGPLHLLFKSVRYYSSVIAGNKRDTRLSGSFAKWQSFSIKLTLASQLLTWFPRDVVCSSGHLLWSQESRWKVTCKIDGGQPPLKHWTVAQKAKVYIT